MNTTITYQSMGLWTELEVVYQSFAVGGARAYLTARVRDDRPAALRGDPTPEPVTILLSQSEMRRLALQLLMETLG